MKKVEKLNFVPAAGKYVVRVEDAKSMTEGGILVPDNAKERPMEGVILSIGEGEDGKLPAYAFKDLVLFGKYSGTEVIIDNTGYLILNEDDILGKRI